MHTRRLLLTALALAAAFCGDALARPAGRHHAAPPPTRHAAIGHGMVAAANPHAVEAGLRVLRAGGSAADAAVAVQAVLGLVEPQSSGLGGGAFMTYYDARTRKVTAYNGRETAPRGATADMFLRPDGKPMSFAEAVLSGRATGTPGAVALLAQAQHDHGRLAWSALFADAERLARDGFKVSPRLESRSTMPSPEARAPDVLAYFTKPDGTRLKTGDILRNPAYAATVRRIAREGAKGLLAGPVARDIAARVAQAPLPGTLTPADMAAYRVKTGPALCRPYRVWIVCAPGLPSGGPVILMALGMLERTDIATRGPKDPQAWFELIQAQRLAFADRDHFMGDPDFVRVPLDGLLDRSYLAGRAALFGTTAGPAPSFGNPPGAERRGPDATAEPGGTSHFVIVDGAGNVVSMTTTVESLFGTGRMVDGFFLNNQLTDFSFAPNDPSGAPAANAVAPGKRPRSSMSPLIVLDRKGRFVAAIGSPGGGAIPAYVLKTLVAVLDWKMPMQQAIDLPNVIAIRDVFVAESDKFAPGVVEGLAQRGVTFRAIGGEDSGLHGVMARDGRLEGGADPRREGVARAY